MKVEKENVIEVLFKIKYANLHLWSLRFVFAIEELWQGTPLNFMYTGKKKVNMQITFPTTKR